jgi:hypothetical protein
MRSQHRTLLHKLITIAIAITMAMAITITIAITIAILITIMKRSMKQ